jgi:hypothetical protein
MDVASVRGIGLSLVGLASAEQVEHRSEQAVQIAAAAEVYAREEGIAVVYAEQPLAGEMVEQARAALSPADLERFTELGRRLTIEEALNLARTAQVAVT